jgi:hypothetical protein
VYEICTRFFQINRRDLVYLKFILEAYEGLSTLSTVDQIAGIVQLSYPACFAGDIANLISALAHDITITEVRHPAPSLEEDFCHA